MLPDFGFDTDLNYDEVETEDTPSLTYYVDAESKRIVGMVDGKEAVKQAALKILATERYGYPIYDSDYGIELSQYIGEDFDFIEADMERVCEEALTADDRIYSIVSFDIEQLDVDSCYIVMEIETVYGNINLEMGVSGRWQSGTI